jgi:ABC-type dipeptide/oligopeptide/nickel transport system permease component
MAGIPKFMRVNKYKDGVKKELAEAFSDSWFLMIVAHLLGIAVGVLASILASSSLRV